MKDLLRDLADESVRAVVVENAADVHVLVEAERQAHGEAGALRVRVHLPDGYKSTFPIHSAFLILL